MRSLFSIGVAANLVLHALLPGGALAAADPQAASQQVSAADGSIDGIWQGEIGDQSVRACFDGGIGSFYRLGDRRIVMLWPDDALTFAEEDDRDPSNPRWRLARLDLDRLNGTRAHGASSQPLRLRRVPFVARPATEEVVPDTPCASFVYHRDRLEPLSVRTETQRAGSVTFDRIVAVLPANPDDVEFRTFRLNGTAAGLAAVNDLLARFIDHRPIEESEWAQCLVDAGNSGGMFHAAIEPTRIGERFVAAIEHLEGSCGGLSPYSANYPRLFDLTLGVEVPMRDWLNADAFDRETLGLLGPPESDGERNVLPLSDVLVRDLVRRAERRDDECAGVMDDQRFWTMGVGRNGFEFSPNLSRVVMACGQTVTLPFDAMERFLSSEGRRGVAILRTESAEFVPWP